MTKSRIANLKSRIANSSLHWLGEEKIVLPIGGGLSISLLELQAILFFIGCLVCSCCSISSYVWGSMSPRYAGLASTHTPRPTRTHTHTPTAIGTYAHTPTSTPTRTQTPTSTSRPTEMSIPATPTRPHAPAATSQSPAPTPTWAPAPTSTPVHTPTPTNTPQPAATHTPAPTNTSQPTSTPANTPTPTDTPTPTPIPSDLHIAYVEYDPPGDALEDEYALVENRGAGSQDMTGWTLSDDSWNTYFFPAGFILFGGDSVRVWTTSGTDTPSDLYWERSGPVWGNQGDTAYLRDNTATVMDIMGW